MLLLSWQAPTYPVERLRDFMVLFIEVNARRPEMARLMNLEGSVAGPRLDYLFERFIAPCLLPAAALLIQPAA